MPCYHPITAWYSKTKNDSGKRSLVFDQTKAKHTGAQVTIPCGRCVGCRLERSRQWAIRCVHEAKLYDENCFITLTYDDDHLPDDLSLHKEHFQLFFKRLRKAYPNRRIRYYHCGEYGEQFARPHYHACIFNFDFSDKVLWSIKNKFRLYISEQLNMLWGKGYCIIGDVTFESAAYVARYIMKKILGSDELKEEVYNGRETEYTTMSRRPGIGAGFFEKYKEDVYKSDSVVLRGGVHVRPPKYYDALLSRDDLGRFESIKLERQGKVEHLVSIFARLDGRSDVVKDCTPDRLEVKEFCKKEKVKNLKRSFEEI